MELKVDFTRWTLSDIVGFARIHTMELKDGLTPIVLNTYLDILESIQWN